MERAEREPFGHTWTPEPQPWGAVTRRAVAQRRSRASGLTRLSAEAIRGFWLPRPLARRSAVCSKSVVFSSLPIRKGLILTFRAVFLQRGYPQSKPCLLLVLYYLFF